MSYRDEMWSAFHVPVNDAGEKEMEVLDYIDNPSPNIKSFYIVDKQNDLLWRLYHNFNEAFGIIIYDCEDERMKKEDVPKALEMAIAFRENAADENTKEAATKLIEILSFAKEHNSLVEFWFQLIIKKLV